MHKQVHLFSFKIFYDIFDKNLNNFFKKSVFLV